MEINYEDFKKISIKVGTVLEVKKNEKARKPSLIIKVDFGKEEMNEVFDELNTAEKGDVIKFLWY